MTHIFHSRRKEQVDPEDPPIDDSRPSPQTRFATATQNLIRDIAQGYLMSGSLTFFSLEQYDVTNVQQEQLWRWEVDRLLRAVNGPSKDFAFQSEGAYQTNEPYCHLKSLVDRILLHLHICTLDNELLLSSSGHQKLHDKAMLAENERVIRKWLGKTQTSNNTGLESNDVFEDEMEEPYVVSFVATVDYITAVVAHVALMSAEDESWQCRVVVWLAKCAAKLKILMRRPEVYAKRSLYSVGISPSAGDKNTGFGQSADSLRDFIASQESYRLGEPRGAKSAANTRMYAKHMASLARLRDHPAFDILDMVFMFRWTTMALSALVSPLVDRGEQSNAHANLILNTALSGFDVSTTIHRAGADDYGAFPIYLHQDWDQVLRGCSHQGFVKYAYPGFKTLQRAIFGVYMATSTDCESSRSELGENSTVPRHEVTYLAFRMGQPSLSSLGPTAVKKGEQTVELVSLPNSYPIPLGATLRLSTVGNILTAMIPFLCTTPELVIILRSTLNQFGQLHAISVEEKLSPPTSSESFTGMVSLYTQASSNKETRTSPDACDFEPLSCSIHAYQLKHAVLGTETRGFAHTSREKAERKELECESLRRRLIMVMLSSVIEEGAVVVRCKLFVYTVLGAAGLLVAGGLIAAFTLGETIPGVDPFGLANFCWLLAAFGILLVRSLRVYEWPWRDFLITKAIKCRSLSELQEATGLDAQALLLFLLTNEHNTLLITRGPYNRVFTRRSDPDSAVGFAIDVKPTVRTLVSAGMVFVVAGHGSEEEVAIECYDFREAQDSDVVMSFEERDRNYICRRPPRKGDRIQDVVLQGSEDVQQGNVAGPPPIRSGILGIYKHFEKSVR